MLSYDGKLFKLATRVEEHLQLLSDGIAHVMCYHFDNNMSFPASQQFCGPVTMHEALIYPLQKAHMWSQENAHRDHMMLTTMNVGVVMVDGPMPVVVN